jgi:flagellar hook-associated protein 2
MTTTPAGAVSGLISGVDYRSLIDQIILNEGQPAVSLRTQEQKDKDQIAAYATYRTLLTNLQTAMKSVKDGSVFDGVTTGVAAISGTRALAGATATSTAAQGTYRVEVTGLARAQKLGSTSYGSVSDALGLADGSFTINGASITVDGNDTLVSLRDKINAADTGSAASKVSASILQVDATHFRLVLTSDVTGAAGMTLANVSGGAPQALGLTDAGDVIQSGAVLVSGDDAHFTVDGVPLTRSSNSITDVIEGVTLNLVAQEDGAVTSVTVNRSADQARAGMQALVDAWNKLVDFTSQQRTPPADGHTAPPLYADLTLKTVSATLATTLLSPVWGAAADLSTAAMAGISIGTDGKLTLDASRFNDAFNNRIDDLRTLFSQRGSATDARVTYISSTGSTAAGSYDVAISQAATQAALLGTGFSGTYADDGTPDSLSITDLQSGAVTTVQLSNGMTTGDIAAALTTAFATPAAQQVTTGTVLYGDPAGTVPMTAATTFAELRLAGGTDPGVAALQTIGIDGVRPNGSSFHTTFAISDPATQTVGDLVAQLQAGYGTAASVSVSGGRIVVQDAQSQASALGLTLTANNEGGGALDFGPGSVTTVGRSSVRLTATDVGGQLQIGASDYGSAPGFTVALTAGGSDGTAQLGLAAGDYHGLDVQGTIGGNAATGKGRTLVGGSGTAVSGLSLSYTGTTIGAAGSATVTLGTGALILRSLDDWLGANTGILDTKTASLTRQAQDLEDRALQIDARLDRRRDTLLKQYAAMETAISRLQNSASGITAMLNAMNNNKQNG